ncbi:MAG: sigma-70 family RNA polymerase sigma factor [Planctomycetia bacterium]|nr:sigma-70 family RNA polymerase sigma factor [Planctomycetia bacterium]
MNTDLIVKHVILAQTGDRAAFSELVRECQPVVYATALEKLRDGGAAQELAHETFVRAWTKLDQLREPAAFIGWIRQICIRLALNRLTRRKVNQVEEGILENQVGDEHNPLETMMRKEARTTIRKGLARLSRLDRETLTAFYIRGESIREMSQALATPEGTIKRRLHVARNRLKARLEGSEVLSVDAC